MATYTPVVDVNITINVVRLAQAGFGIPMFIDAHVIDDERTTGLLTSPQDLLDLGFAENSNAYKAAVQFYAQQPPIDGFKVGRRAASFLGQPLDVDGGGGSVHNLTVTIPSTGDSVTATYTASGADTEEDVATDLAADINTALGSFVTASVSGSGTAARVLIVPDDFEVIFQATYDSVADNMTGTYQGIEGAAACLAAIRDYDDEWYFLTTHDRDTTWVDAMAVAIQSAGEPVDPNTPSYGKMYFQASADVTNFDAPYDGDNTGYSIFSTLRSKNLTRTVSFYHQTADANYPECAYVGHNAAFDAGSVTWANITLLGLAPSAHPVTGRRLTSGQKNNLASNNANFIETDAGVDIVRFGITSSQEWIDIIRGVDWLTSEVETAIKRLLYSQKGKKIPYTDQGIAQVREVIHSALQSAVNRNFFNLSS